MAPYTVTYHGFINWVSSFVRENAGGQTTDDFLYTEFIANVKNIVVDFHVVSKKSPDWPSCCETILQPVKIVQSLKMSKFDLSFSFSRYTIAAKCIT